MSIRVGVLTSSRADFGIYLPLLKKLNNDPFFLLEIIAFGTHLSYLHGYTVDDIRKSGFTVSYQIESLVVGDTAESTATSTGLTTIKFSSFWAKHQHDFDYIFCLGDRYEMFAAVSAAIPFNLRLVHFHGGEKTLGAIDNIYRHSISHAASVHFTSTEDYADRLRQMLDESDDIYNVGALSLDSLSTIKILDKYEFLGKWHINMELPTILTTLHSETGKGVKKNWLYAEILAEVINELTDFRFVITMPNADTNGNVIRDVFRKNLTAANFYIVENFGTQGYLSCMALSVLVLGNSSSGIIEAASLGKYVINIGERQAGRKRSGNTFDLPFEKGAICNKIRELVLNPSYIGPNVYWNGGAVDKVVKIFKQKQYD